MIRLSNSNRKLANIHRALPILFGLIPLIHLFSIARDLEIVNNRVPLCRDAIGGRCTRNRCRFYHIPEEILENRQRQCIINTVQSSCLSDNCSLDNASDADVIAIPTSTSNDGDGAPASANDPAKASSAFKAEGDSGNNKSPVVQSHSTQSPNIQSSKSEPSERS